MVSIEKTGIMSASGEINENLLTGSAEGLALTSTGERSAKRWCNRSGGNGTITVIEDGTACCGKYIYRIAGNTSGNKDVAQYDSVDPFVMTSGVQYTMSAYYRGQGTALLRIWNRTNGSQVVSRAQAFDTNGEWQRLSYTFNAPAAVDGVNNVGFSFGITGTGETDICGMKVEESDHPTPWVPNELDDIYVGNINGFIETADLSRIAEEYVEGNDFIEY